ncbi:hypothetical protein HYW67_02355 [Candidatus Parcubacteria bacterium]|nr:hypothetical protein [Candidatus Parcubacteria bacterium]
MPRMVPVKPTVYEVTMEDRQAPEDKWGWFDLGEISRITNLPRFVLLLRFFDCCTPPKWIRGAKTHVFYYRAAPCEDPENFQVFALDVRYFESAHQDCRCGGHLKEMGLNRYVESHRIFVPAGWGLAVLQELRDKKKKN